MLASLSILNLLSYVLDIHISSMFLMQAHQVDCLPRNCPKYQHKIGHPCCPMKCTLVGKLSLWQCMIPLFWSISTNVTNQISMCLICESCQPIGCGCTVVLRFSDVSNIFHKTIRKWLRNLMSRSEVIVIGTPRKRITSQEKNLAILMHWKSCGKE